MGRILGVDYGKARVGLAVSDGLGLTASPLEVLTRQKKTSLVESVCRVALREGVTEIVVGLPLRADGSSGVAASAARSFADAIRHKSALKVSLFDERMSTFDASRAMTVAGVKTRDQRGVVDKVAAALILRGFLDSKRGEATGGVDPLPPRHKDRRRQRLERKNIR